MKKVIVPVVVVLVVVLILSLAVYAFNKTNYPSVDEEGNPIEYFEYSCNVDIENAAALFWGDDVKIEGVDCEKKPVKCSTDYFGIFGLKESGEVCMEIGSESHCKEWELWEFGVPFTDYNDERTLKIDCVSDANADVVIKLFVEDNYGQLNEINGQRRTVRV